MSDSIKVAVRIRPLIQRERDADAKIIWNNTDDSIQQKNGTGKFAAPYNFDRVFGIEETTSDVFQEIANPIVEGAMLGFNGTIFAYGQTSSGKTFTMMGTQRIPGIIPGVIKAIFDNIESNLEREYLIRVSYLEIYNEHVTDLLSADKKPLDVREDSEGNVFVANLKEELVTNMSQIMKLMASGDLSRHVGATNMNESSSRSHAIFRVIIESRVRDQEGAVMVSQLNLVDLAGSEKAKATGASGQRLTEGGFINKSLFILGNVISQLSEAASFINYRDSRLTRILQNSLGGNSKTAIICNVSPAVLEETHSSLRFATNAKRIKNKPVQNEVLSDAALMQRYKKEVDQLKKKLSETRNLKGVVLLEENEQLQQQLAAKDAMQASQEERIARLTDLICVSSRIRPTTPNTNSLEARRKRRETWCPGKGGRAAGALKPKSLSAFPEALDDNFATERIVNFRLPDSSPESLPELAVNMTHFSNEDEEFLDVGCQTEKRESVSEGSDEEKEEMFNNLREELQRSQQEVEKLNQLLDAHLEGERNVQCELQHEILTTKDKLQAVEDRNAMLEKNLAAAELLTSQKEAELKEIQAAAPADKSSRKSTLGGLELVQQQLERLRAQLEEKNRVIGEKEQSVTTLQTQHNDMVLLAEEVMEEVATLKNSQSTISQERDSLQIQLEAFKIQMENREAEFREMEEFLTSERDMKNESIMVKQYGEDLVADLQKRCSVSEQSSEDGQAVIMDLSKMVSQMKTEREDLQLKLREAEMAIQELTNKISDFDMYQELDRDKHKRRESELTAQLEDAYRENSELRSATCGVPAGGHSLDMSLQAALAACSAGGGGGNLEASLQAADNLQIEELNGRITELQNQILEMTEIVEKEKTEKENVEKQFEASKETISQTQEECDARTREKVELEASVMSLKEEIETLQLDVTKSAEETSELRRQLEETLSKESEDKGDSKRSAEELVTLTTAKETLEDELKILKEKICVFENDMKEKTEETQQLLGEKEDLTVEKMDLEKEKTTLDEELKTLKEERVVFEEKIRERSEETHHLVEKNEGLLNEKTALEEEKKTLIEEIKSFKVDALERSQEKSEVTDHVVVESEGLTEERIAFEEAKLCLETERFAFADEKQDFETQKKSIEELQLCIESEKTTLEALKVELEKDKETLGAEKRSLEKDLEESKLRLVEEVAALEEEKQGLESAKAALDQEKEILKEEKITLEEDKLSFEEQQIIDRNIAEQILEEEKEQLEEQRKSLEEKKNVVEQEREAFAREKSVLENVANTQENEKDGREKETNALEEERLTLEKQKKTIEEMTMLLEEEKQIFEEEKQALADKTAQCKQFDEEKESLETEKNAMEEELKEERLMLEKERKTIEEVTTLLEEEKQIFEEEKQALADKTAQCKQFDEEKESLETEKRALEEELKEERLTLEKERKTIEEVTTLLEEEKLIFEEEKKALADKTAQHKQFEQEKHIWEIEKKAMEEQIAMLEEEIKVLKCEIDSNETKLQAEILAIRTEAMAKLEEAKEMLSKPDMNETRQLEAEMQQELLKAEIEQLSLVLKRRDQDLQEKVAAIQELKDAIKTLEEKKNDDDQVIETLQEQIENLKHGTQEIVNGVMEERDAAWATISELKEELDRLGKREEELEHQASQHLEEVERQCTLHAEEIKQLSALHTEEVERQTTLHAEEVQEMIQTLTQERDQARELIDEMDQEILKFKEEKEKMETDLIKKIASLEEQLQAAPSKDSAGEDSKMLPSIDHLKTTIDVLTDERDQARALIDEVDEEIQKIKEEKQKIEAELTQKVQKLEAELVKVSATPSSTSGSDLQAEVKQLKGTVEHVIKERDHARQLIDEVDEEIETLKEEKEKTELRLTQEIKKLEEQLQAASSKDSGAEDRKTLPSIDHLKATVDLLTRERDQAQGLIDEVDEEIQKIKEEKQKTEAELTRKVQKLEAELVKVSATPSSTSGSDLQAEVKQLKGTVEHVIKERDHARQLIDEVDEEIETLKEEKEKTELCLTQKIKKLEEQLQAAPSKDSSGEDRKTLPSIDHLKATVDLLTRERDQARGLIDEIDEEIQKIKEEKQKTEAELTQKVQKLEAELVKVSATPSSTSGSNLQAEVKQLKGTVEHVLKERDYARKLIDEVDEEIETLKEEKEKTELRLTQKIKKLEDELVRGKRAGSYKSGAEDGVTNEENSRLQAALKESKERIASAELRESRLTEKLNLLIEELRSYKERVTSQRSEIRRLQNQNSDTSFMPRRERERDVAETAPLRARSQESSVGIIGSVKVLTLESENCSLQRELKALKAENNKVLQDHNKLVKTVNEQQKHIDKYRRLCKKTPDDVTASEERVLKGLANGASPAKRSPAQPKRKGSAGVGATAAPPKSSTSKLVDEFWSSGIPNEQQAIKELYEEVFKDELLAEPPAKEKIEPCSQQ